MASRSASVSRAGAQQPRCAAPPQAPFLSFASSACCNHSLLPMRLVHVRLHGFGRLAIAMLALLSAVTVVPKPVCHTNGSGPALQRTIQPTSWPPTASTIHHSGLMMFSVFSGVHFTGTVVLASPSHLLEAPRPSACVHGTLRPENIIKTSPA